MKAMYEKLPFREMLALCLAPLMSPVYVLTRQCLSMRDTQAEGPCPSRCVLWGFIHAASKLIRTKVYTGNLGLLPHLQ